MSELKGFVVAKISTSVAGKTWLTLRGKENGFVYHKLAQFGDDDVPEVGTAVNVPVIALRDIGQ